MSKNKVRKVITSNIKHAVRNKMEISDFLEGNSLTGDKINQMVLADAWPNSKGIHIEKDLFFRELGFFDFAYKLSDDDYGAGSERFIAHADFALRSTFTLKDVKLTRGLFNRMSNEVINLVDVISDDFSKNALTVIFEAQDNKINFDKSFAGKKGYVVFASGSLDLNAGGTYAKFLVSNIKNEFYDGDINDCGDISVHLLRVIGNGANLFPKNRKLGHSKSLDSVKVEDIFVPNNYLAEAVSNGFKRKVGVALNGFESEVKKYHDAIRQASSRNYSQSEHYIITMHNK